MVTVAPSNSNLFSLAPGENLNSTPVLTHTGRKQPGILPEELTPQKGEIKAVEMNDNSGSGGESPFLVKSRDILGDVCDGSAETVTAVAMDVDKRKDEGIPVASLASSSVWSCHHCVKTFTSSRALKIHEVKQHEEATSQYLKCGSCDEVFEHANLLQIHMKIHHNIKVRCPRCKDVFDHPNLLKMHFKTNHSEPVCMVCGVKFDHDKLLKLHMEHYHKLGEKGNKKDLLAFCQELSVNVMNKPVDQEYTPWTNGSNSQENESKAFEHFSRESEESRPMINVYEKEQNPDKQLSPNPLSAASNYMEQSSSIENKGELESDLRRYNESNVIPVRDRESRDERLARCRTQSYENVGCGFPRGAEDHKQFSGNGERQSFYNSHQVRAFLGDVKKETDKECAYFETPSRGGYDEKHRVETGEVATGQFDSHHGFDNQSEQEDKCETPTQVYRPSVITSNCSSFRRSPQRAEEYVFEKHRGRESVADSDRGSEQTESCPGTDDDAFDSSGESDSSSIGDNKLFTKRNAPRCNRCQQTFTSKMEYLHHLIAHQRGDQMKIRYPQFDEQEKNHAKTFLHELRGSRVYNSVRDSRELLAETENPLSQLHSLSLLDSPTTPQILPFGEPSTQRSGRRRSIATEKDLQCPDEIYPKNLPYGRVACSECNEIFNDALTCRVHIERHHSRLRCKECGLKFDHRKLLRIHIESYHSSKEMLKCFQCGQSFEERSHFVSHVTLHQEELRNREEDSEKQVHRQSRTNKNISPEREGKPSCFSGPAERSHQDSEYESEQKPTAKELLEYSQRVRSESAVGVHDHGINPARRATTIPRDDQPESLGDYDMKESEGTKTRIFIPKFEANQQLLPGTDFNPMHSFWRAPADGRGNAPLKKPLKRTRSAPPETSKRVSTIVSTMDCSSPGENTGTPRELIGSPYMVALQNSMIKRIKQEFDVRSESILHGPPPLIPIHRRPSQPEVEATHRLQDNQFLNVPTREPDMQLPTSKSTAGAPRQKTKLARSFSAPHRDTRIRESIQTATKEALLNTLSLKRRVALLEQNNLLRKQQESAAHADTHVNATNSVREGTPMQQPQASLNHAADTFREKEFSQFQAGQRKINKNFDCHHCGLHFDHKKLLKIHLDAYHGSATRMSCDRCDLTFIDRGEFLNHLMSHPEDEQGFQPRYNRPYVRRKSKALANGEAVVSRELNPVVKYAEEPESEKKVETLPVDQSNRDLRANYIQQGRAQVPSTETVVIPGLRIAGDSMVLREYHVPGVVSHEQPFKKGKFKQNPGDQSKECFVCGKVFDSGRRLEVHISSHASLDKDGRYCCSLCSKTFDHHRKLEIHTRSHTGFKPHKCDLCGRCFPYYSSFYYHKMTHTKDKPHKCPLCGKGFIQTRYLRTHLRTHKDWQGNSSGEENIASPSTPLSEAYESTDSPTDSPTMCFQNSEQPDDNAFEADANDLEQSTAEILCSFKANSRRRESLLSSGSCPDNHRVPSPTRDYALHNEKQDFTNENIPDESASVFECCVCNKNCETAEELQAHSQTHQTEKPYHCKQCNKSFSAYSSLYVHNRIHTGQRPYSCKYCGKKFTHASGLKRHVRCHTGERPYPCPLCPSAFADRGALRSHIRTHTGERPYKCNWCGKTYTQPSSLKVHKRTLHVEEEMKAKSAKMKK